MTLCVIWYIVPYLFYINTEFSSGNTNVKIAINPILKCIFKDDSEN